MTREDGERALLEFAGVMIGMKPERNSAQSEQSAFASATPRA